MVIDLSKKSRSSQGKKTIETTASLAPWKILVVDDEPDVHTVTKLALSRFKLDGRALHFINAYSAEQAKELLAKEQDLAIAFIDVVMESDHAGLELVKWIREEHKTKRFDSFYVQDNQDKPLKKMS